MQTDADRRAALRAVHRLLEPGGRFVFDVFAPAPDDIERDARPLARARAGHLRARRLGRGRAHARPARPRRGRRGGAQPRVALGRGVARAARRGGLRRRGPLRLVRPHARGRGARGLDLGLPNGTADGIILVCPPSGRKLPADRASERRSLTRESLQFPNLVVGSRTRPARGVSDIDPVLFTFASSRRSSRSACSSCSARSCATAGVAQAARRRRTASARPARGDLARRQRARLDARHERAAAA